MVATVLVSAFGLLGLALAIIGLYGVLSYSVSRQTGDNGLRIAMGATRNDILRVVLRSGMRLTSVGAVIGLIVSVAAGRLVVGLYNVSAIDPVSLVAISPILAFGLLARMPDPGAAGHQSRSHASVAQRVGVLSLPECGAFAIRYPTHEATPRHGTGSRTLFGGSTSASEARLNSAVDSGPGLRSTFKHLRARVGRLAPAWFGKNRHLVLTPRRCEVA